MKSNCNRCGHTYSKDIVEYYKPIMSQGYPMCIVCYNCVDCRQYICKCSRCQDCLECDDKCSCDNDTHKNMDIPYKQYSMDDLAFDFSLLKINKI